MPRSWRVLIDKAKAGDDLPPPPMGKIEVGAVGTVRRFQIKIVQRVMPGEARIGILREATPDELRLIRKGFLPRPTTDVLAEEHEPERDGRRAVADDVAMLCGHRYPNLYDGPGALPRTVFVFEPFETKGAEAIYKKALAEEGSRDRTVGRRRSRTAERGQTPSQEGNPLCGPRPASIPPS